MACHFSPYGTGLSNLPPQLPPGSMVIVNDRTPVSGHDPQYISAILRQIVQDQQVSHVLLDFQRPGDSLTSEITKAIVDALDCPIGVTQWYAEDLACGVFLPPPPLHLPIADYLRPWEGRPVWLELAPDCACYTITEDGCKQAASNLEGTFPHTDPQAYCGYRIEISDESIRFLIKRGPEELEQIRRYSEIACFVGLYQDFAQPEAQDTALAQWDRRSCRSCSEISG